LDGSTVCVSLIFVSDCTKRVPRILLDKVGHGVDPFLVKNIELRSTRVLARKSFLERADKMFDRQGTNCDEQIHVDDIALSDVCSTVFVRDFLWQLFLGVGLCTQIF
jgi:hypothetical protein